MRRWLYRLSTGLLAIAAVGLAVRFTVRDEWPVTAWIYYFFGLPAIVAGVLAAAGAAALAAGRKTRAAFAVALAVAVAAVWWITARHVNPCKVAPDSLRVVSWNVSRLRTNKNQVVADLKRFDADVILLTEAGNNNAGAQEFWRSHFGGYEIALPGGGIVAMFRGRIEATSYRTMEGISSYAQFETIVDRHPIRIVVVDLDASPRFNKRVLVPRVFDLATAGAESAVLVAGDFNTPADSPAFSRVRAGFRHAFESAGDGLLATWPARLPITAIDHVWTGPGIVALCATLHATPASDHRAVVVDALF